MYQMYFSLQLQENWSPSTSKFGPAEFHVTANGFFMIFPLISVFFFAFQWPSSNCTFICLVCWFTNQLLRWFVARLQLLACLDGLDAWTKEASYQTLISLLSHLINTQPRLAHSIATMLWFPMFCSNCDFFIFTKMECNMARLNLLAFVRFVHTKSQVLLRQNFLFSTLLDDTGATLPPHI